MFDGWFLSIQLNKKFDSNAEKNYTQKHKYEGVCISDVVINIGI